MKNSWNFYKEYRYTYYNETRAPQPLCRIRQNNSCTHLSQPKAQAAQAKLEADIRRNIRLCWFITNQSPRKPTRDYYSLWRLFSIGLYAHSKSATPVFFTFKPFAEQPQRRCLSKSYDWSYHNGKSFHLKLAHKIFKFEDTTDHMARKVYNAVCNSLVVES